jgi:hypothetical protein
MIGAEKFSRNQIIWRELKWGKVAKSSTPKSVLLLEVKKAPTYRKALVFTWKSWW